jgi:hypothetical protein
MPQYGIWETALLILNWDAPTIMDPSSILKRPLLLKKTLLLLIINFKKREMWLWL